MKNFKDYIPNNTKTALLLEPDFTNKAKRKKEYYPVGLLKIGALLRQMDIEPTLQQLSTQQEPVKNTPDVIFITSVFTYWSEQVKNAVDYCNEHYSGIPTIIGGIYAILLPEHCKNYTGCTDIIQGQIPEAEKLIPAFDLLQTDYQIIHTTRGCIRKCDFCQVYKIEPKWTYKKTIKDEIVKTKLLFYDNNVLANPYIEDILDELIQLKKQKKIINVGFQSGLDGRILQKKTHLAKKIKKAGGVDIRIAWDGPLEDYDIIKRQIQILTQAGFSARTISVFVLFNYNLSYEDIERKRQLIAKLGAQITICRYIPPTVTKDGYDPRKWKNGQEPGEYYIHPGWTDQKIRQTFRNIRKHNICMRYNIPYHSTELKQSQLHLLNLPFSKGKEIISDAWSPYEYHKIRDENKMITKEDYEQEKQQMIINKQEFDDRLNKTIGFNAEQYFYFTPMVCEKNKDIVDDYLYDVNIAINRSEQEALFLYYQLH